MAGCAGLVAGGVEGGGGAETKKKGRQETV